MRISLSIEAQSPLAISHRKPDGQFRGAFDYVPGSIVRGALANAMIHAGELGSPLFAKLFTVSEAAIFANAYPLVDQKGFGHSRPLPLTAMSCKREPGFLADRHGVFDTLIDRVCFELLTPEGLLYVPKCPTCGEQSDRYEGLHAEFGVRHQQPEAGQRLLTRVALNRRRQVAEDGLLYSPLVLSEARRTWDERKKRWDYAPVRFSGSIHGDLTAEEAQQVKSLCEQVSHLGGGASRGLGSVKIRAETQPLDAAARGRDIESRVKAFNAKLWREDGGGRWSLWSALADARPTPSINPREGVFFTVGLGADAIMYTLDHRPTIHLLPQALGEVGSVQLVRAFAAYDYRGGWNSAWGLPKDTEVITRIGSTYLCWVENGKLDYKQLANLERSGIGRRTQEGFGQVRICDEFHLVLQEDPK